MFQIINKTSISYLHIGPSILTTYIVFSWQTFLLN